MITIAMDMCRVQVLWFEMASVRKCCFVCSMWMLLLFPSAITTWNCTELNTTQTAHLGMSITVSIHYSTDSSLHSVIYFRRDHLLCSYIFLNKSWIKASCESHIRFIWIQETEEISFELLNLHISNSGVYTLTVEQHVPPPTRCVGKKTIFIQVTAYPIVSMSCVKRPDRSSTILCAAEGFYPADLEQVWLRDGEYISYLNTSLECSYEENLNTSDINCNYRNNTDGSYSLTSYLSSQTPQKVMYYCWVNHSTLSQPITVNISSTECTEREEALTGLFAAFAGISCILMAFIALIITCFYQHLRRRLYLQSPIRASPSPELVSHYAAQTQVYSTLGEHRPVPCKINSSRTTYSTV
ncbi:hypothetical protein KOW79_013716 [Hemibagrus wyckioides]|uniref:Ig-like domain-containing protein n=1 Tax=Hemibagrus wyckioides TaxID=337641 RepID=A0A9D3SFY8_9TELE|nr:uncharacterized protein LOC131366673 isoform X2 [Hemibagrus wyckioides]KAG7322370.1 hypothetical protein KOW79_013716 [Hemibagrus wyckioides]